MTHRFKSLDYRNQISDWPMACRRVGTVCRRNRETSLPLCYTIWWSPDALKPGATEGRKEFSTMQVPLEKIVSEQCLGISAVLHRARGVTGTWPRWRCGTQQSKSSSSVAYPRSNIFDDVHRAREKQVGTNACEFGGRAHADRSRHYTRKVLSSSSTEDDSK